MIAVFIVNLSIREKIHHQMSRGHPSLVPHFKLPFHSKK